MSLQLQLQVQKLAKQLERELITVQPPMDRQTELMLKYGPKDTCYAATYDNEELLKKYFIKSATFGREDNPMVNNFFETMENKYNDHRSACLFVDSSRIEIIDISKTIDIPTIQGLQLFCRQILTSGIPPYRYHGAGNSNIEARSYQQKLYGETEPRADMTIAAQGSITRSLQSIKAIGSFPASFPTITVKESAIFNNSTGYTAGTMLNRQVFNSTPINHTVNVLPFTVATDVNFVSVTTYG